MKTRLSILVILAITACLSAAGSLAGRAGAAQKTVSNQLRTAPAPKPKSAAQVHKFSAKEALAKFLSQNQVFPEKFVAQLGLAASDSDPSTGEVWATVISDGRDGFDRGYAGFYTVTIENTSGVPWTASVHAAFDITMLQGQVTLYINIYKDNGHVEGRFEQVSSLGARDLATSKFTIEPGSKYHAVVSIFCEPPAKDQAVSVKARIRNVKWNIEL